MLKNLLIAAALVGAFALGFAAAEAAEPDVSKAKCPVMDKAARATAAADYKGAKVYFCCPGCVGAFAKNTEKYAAKANQQLVATGQASQKACPLTGRPVNAEVVLEVDGVPVSFCCNGCKGRVAGAEGEQQVNLVFSSGAFEKGFQVGKEEEEE